MTYRDWLADGLAGRAPKTVSTLVGIRTEEARALRWDHVDLEGDPDADPPVPPHVDVWRSVRAHGDTKTKKSRRSLGLPRMAVEVLREHLQRQADLSPVQRQILALLNIPLPWPEKTS